MTLLVDCSTCPVRPRACGDCSVGLLLGPVAPETPEIAPEPGLTDAIVTFASAGMLAGLRLVPDQAKKAG